MADDYRTQRWGRHIDELMTEIAREAVICKVRLLDPGVIDAVLRNNESVAGSQNPRAFQKLRQLLQMGFIVQGKAYEALGPADASELVAAVRETLKERLGDRLGG
jgi:hypothetical protein